MAKVDTNKVRVGTIDNFIVSRQEGRRRSGGYGFIRGQGHNAGTAFALLGDFVSIGYSEQEFSLYTSSVGETANKIFVRGDAVVLALVEPTPDRGPKAAWWATQASWDAALRKRREHVLTRHTDNDNGTVAEIQFFVNLNGTEHEVGHEMLPVREETKLHDSSYWETRVEEFDDGLWLIQQRTPNYEFLRTQIREVAQLPTGPVTKFELARVQDGWVAAPVERRFRPTRIWTQPIGYNSDQPSRENLEKVFHSGYPDWKIKATGVDPDGNETAANLSCPSRAGETGVYARKDNWPWSEVPQELKLQYYREWPACVCRKKRYHRDGGEIACHDCAQRAKYGTCACGRPASEYRKVGEQYYCNYSDCKAGKLPKALEMLKQALWASSNEDLRSLDVVATKVAEEAKRLLKGTVVVTGAEEVRTWLEAKAQELVPDGWFADHRRRDMVNGTRLEYSDSNPIAVVECSNGYYASHQPKGLLHRLAKLPEVDETQQLETLACVVSSDYAQRVQKHKVNPRANRKSPEQKFEFPALTAENWRWLVYHLDRGEPVIAPFFAYSTEYVETTRGLVDAAGIVVAQLREQYGREAQLGTFCKDELERASRLLQEAKFAEARNEAQKVQDTCAAKQAELDARRAEQSRGQVWLNVQVPVSTKSRIRTRTWAVRPDGSIMEPIEKLCHDVWKGSTYAHVYGDIPTEILVISHEDDNYGYRKSERWQVYYLPKELTVQQHETVRHLLDDSRVYFSGREAKWDLDRVGKVTVCTSYGRSDHIMGEEELYDEMINSTPFIDMAEWRVQAERLEYVDEPVRVTYEVQHKPRSPRPTVPVSSVVRQANEETRPVQINQQDKVREEGQMEEAGNRHFRCLTSGCGRMDRVSKSDWHAYLSGQVLTVICIGCGKTATVKK